ncbi:unnamed protein product [Clonostachys rhizophaga]|uniref:Fungal-type protein kinase domain-containing protein n=1 Tax=Clonostachys rhizophaga TaxID=160324 RepID=A0A9N9VAU5_9HYPO|nr:unnamed protein product [Clonostachys rhizophaga]
MAVEVLRKVDHTYIHDLVSFFYVLIWICAPQSWQNGFTVYRSAKDGDTTVNRLEEIVGEFPELLDVVKPLCLRIRKILFP